MELNLTTKEDSATHDNYKEEQREESVLRVEERIKQEHAFNPEEEPVLLIIPDVHGRTFWKSAVMKYPELPVIFLGDYLDPYNNYIERISKEEALYVFMDILKYKKTHKKNVTLLLGNHDLHYFSDMDCSRKDYLQFDEINNLYEENIHHFKLVETRSLGDKDFIFSHAGILPGWLKANFTDVNIHDASEICTVLNKRLETDSDFITELVECVPFLRGGCAKYGSPVWADLREHNAINPYTGTKRDVPFSLPDNIIQIFGHTQQEKDPVFSNNFCCLDCRRPFLLTAKGVVMEMEGVL